MVMRTALNMFSVLLMKLAGGWAFFLSVHLRSPRTQAT